MTGSLPMKEKIQIEKGMLAESLNEVLDKAHVPMRHHLSVLKTMDENLAKHKEDRNTHQQMMLAHAQQMSSSEQSNQALLQEMQRQSEAHDGKIAQFEEELARHKTLLQGDPGYTPQKGVDYFDAEAPSIEEIVASVIPHIPPPEKGEPGKNVEFDKEALFKEMVDRFRREKPLDVSHIRNAQTFMKDGIKYKIEELMRGAGGTSTGSSGFQVPLTGAVNGSNQVFTWTTAPKVIVVDQGRPMQRISSDGTINWTGTTTTTLAVAPNYDIFATN